MGVNFNSTKKSSDHKLARGITKVIRENEETAVSGQPKAPGRKKYTAISRDGDTLELNSDR